MKLATLLTFILISTTISINLKKDDKVNTKDTSPLDNAKIETIREIVTLSFKKIENDNGSGKTCLDLMLNDKHGKDNLEFWRELTKVFDITSPRPYLNKNHFADWADKVGKKEKLSNGKFCNEIINEYLLKDEVLITKSKEMKDSIYPLITRVSTNTSDNKHFITAFTGVHRFTKESNKLIPLLNKKD